VSEYQGPRPEYGGFGPRNGGAVVGLVLGILAIILSWIVVGLPLALVGLVLAVVGLRRVGRGQATNPVVAIVALAANVVALVVAVPLTALYVLGGAALWNGGGGDLLHCVRSADGQRAAVQACADEFRERHAS
jgi:hypothetical protein